MARVRAGEQRAAALLMRDLDDDIPGAHDELRLLYPAGGRALIIGLTGSPGSGKSTLCDMLIEHYRGKGARVGVVAIDPTSPFSGGAILGDRIRMQRHATDPGVFIRSLATRGHLGGLSRSTGDLVCVLDAMGYEIVIIETVGVGQDEVDVVSQAQVTVVVTVPGLGDEVQAIKAGILEIADVLVVNKADREGADRAVRDLRAMLELRPADAPLVEIVTTVATSGSGVGELCAAIDSYRRRSAGMPADARALARSRAQLHAILTARILAEAERRLGSVGLDALARQVARREVDPYGAAESVLDAVLRSPPDEH